MSATTYPLFGKAVYYNELNIDTKKIVSMIDTPRLSFGDSSYGPVRLDKTGPKALQVLDEDKFKFLKDIILNEVHSYMHGVMGYTNKFKITTSWFIKIDAGEGAQLHNHLNAMVSGVLYLKTPPNCGNIIFQDLGDKRFNLVPERYNMLNCREWIFTPKEGLLILFPSELYHKVEVNESKQARYSMSFNIMPTGLIGDETSDSHMILK
jgi:uncharacterized protein (TIGR02466 family)